MADYSKAIEPLLIKALEATGNAVDKAVDVVQEQAPILVHEMMTWYFVYNLIQAIASVVVAFVVYKIVMRVYRNVQEKKWDDFAYFPTAILIGITLFLCGIMFNLQWLKIWIAPRLWLIEYTASLVK